MGKRKSHIAKDILDIFSMLPWWVGVPSAIGSYYGLHLLSLSGYEHSKADVVGVILDTAVRTLSYYLQFALPCIILIGVLIGIAKSYKRKSLLKKANNIQAIRDMTWQEFELLVAQFFRVSGYRVIENGGGGADGGIDVKVSKGNEHFIVQCKQWKAQKIGVDIVREHYGVMASKGVAGGFVITCGEFTKDAIAFAAGLNVKLIDGLALEKLIQETGVVKMVEASTAKKEETVKQTGEESLAAPKCLKCGADLVKRKAKSGVNAGKYFWGCSTFPQCRYILNT